MLYFVRANTVETGQVYHYSIQDLPEAERFADRVDNYNVGVIRWEAISK